MKGVFNNFRNLSAFFAAGAVATAGMVAFPVSAVAFDITSPGSDGSTCYFSNGQVGGHIGRSSAYEAAVGVSSGDTRTTLVNSNDDKQKLWFGSQNYPNTYVNFNGKTTQIGYKVPAEHTLTSIDSGRGCLQSFSQDGYNFRYFVRAMPNSRVISRIMEVENVSQDNPTAWHYSSGGDTWFAGDDRGTAGLIGSFPYIKQSEQSGIMMNVPILPEGAKFNYLAGHYQTVNYKVCDVTTDENFFDGSYQDQGIGIKIHGQPIPKGRTVTFGGSMSVGEASGLQILASDAQKIVSGDRATHTFTLINLSKDPVTEHLATDATNGWSTSIVGSPDVTIPGYGQLVVKVDHIMPNTANLTQANSSSRISFRASGTFTSFASSTSEIVAPELNTLAATCRLANSLQTTADWSIPPTKEPVLKLNSSGFGTSLGKTAAPYINYTFDLSNRNIAGTFPVTVSGENWNFTKTVNLDVPSWNVPTISANNEYTFEIPEGGTTIPDMAPIVASPADGVNVAANCNGAVSLSAEGLPDGVAFTDGKFTGTAPESGWYQVKLKAKYANDDMNKAEKIVLLQFKRAADTTPVPKPAITLDTIVLNHKTGDTVDYALPAGYSNLSGVLPPGISVVDGKLVGTLPADQVGEYDFSVKVDGNIQPYKFYSRDGIAPVITSGQPFLSAGSDGTTIKVKMSLSAFDNIDGKVPLRLTGLPTGFTWDGTNLNGSFPSGKTSSSLKVYAYATDQAGNEQNGLYEIKLPLVTVENKNGENVLTTGGGRPEVVLQPSVTVETGKDVAIPLQFLPSTADSVLTTNVTGLPDGLTYDPDSQTIKGTPVDSSLGELTVQVTATDSVGGDLAEPSPRIMKLTVVDKTPPTIEGLPDVISVKTDEPFSFTGTATDGSGTVTWESEGFGENISFNNGVVSSTGISTPQSALVTVKAIDSSGNTTTKQIVVNVLERPAYSLPDLTVDTRPFQKVLIPADSGAEIVSCDFAAIPGSPKPTVQKSDTGDWVMSGQVFTLGTYNVTCGVKNVATGSVVDDSFVLTVQQGAAPDPEPGTPGQDTQNLPPVIAGYLDTSTAVGWKVDIAGKITSPDGTTPTVAVSSEDGEVTYDPATQTVSFKGDAAGEATIKISAVGENGKVTTKTVKVTVVDAGNGSGTIVVPTPTPNPGTDPTPDPGTPGGTPDPGTTPTPDPGTPGGQTPQTGEVTVKYPVLVNGNTTDLLTISPTVSKPSGIALKFKLTETPEELSIDENSGVISGKMIKPGDYRLVGTVSASGGEIAVTIMLHVNDTTPPTAELKSLTPVKLGENFSQKVLDNISDNSEEFTVSTNIPGVTVSPDGVLTGKLTTSGDHAGVVTVTDPSGNKLEFKVVLKVDGETPNNPKPNDGGNKPTSGGVDRPSVIPVVPDNKSTPDAKSPEKEKPGDDNLPSVSDKTPGVTPDNAVKSGATVSPSENVPTKSNGGLAGASPVKTPFFSNSDGVQLSKTGTASFTMGLASLSLVIAGGCLLFASRRRSKQVD